MPTEGLPDGGVLSAQELGWQADSRSPTRAYRDVAGRHRSSSVAPFARWEGLPHAWRCAQDARTCWGHQGATETALSFGLRQFGSQRIPLYPHTIEDYVSCHTVLYPTLPYPTLPCHPNTHNPQNHSAILRRGQTMPLPCQVPP